MQNILRIILSIDGGIPNVKHHVATDGGKQLYNTEAGVWFKEVKQSRESDLDLILNRNIFSELRNSASDGKLQRGLFDWLLLSSPFLHVNSTLQPPHYLQLITAETDSLLSFNSFFNVHRWRLFTKKSDAGCMSHSETEAVLF